MNFERDADAHVVALVLHRGGRERRAPRISADSAASTNDAYKQRLAQEERPRTVAVVDPKSFDGYVGKYLLSPGVVMTATREGDRLFMQLSGQKKYELFPEGGREFFYTIVAAQITFVSDEPGPRQQTWCCTRMAGTCRPSGWIERSTLSCPPRERPFSAPARWIACAVGVFLRH